MSPIEMAMWKLNGNEAVQLPASALDKEQRLEEILEGDPSILGLELLLIIGRQVITSFGRFIDLLALDPQGDLYVIELKRDRTPREVIAQALDYGSWVKDLGYEEISSIYETYRPGASFEEALSERFGDKPPDELNANHQLIIVASELDASTERIVDYLTEFDVPINVVFFRYLKDGGSEYLARSWLISPAETETRTSKKKRPWNGRDFYISFGSGSEQRHWDDARRYGFVSGGGDPWYSRTLNALQPDHRVFVHLPGEGYVGVGRVTESAQPVGDFTVEVDGRSVLLLETELKAPRMAHHLGDPDKDEYVVRVEWIEARSREEAFWEEGLFANQNTAARLRDTGTIRRLEEHFGLSSESSD